MPTTISIGQRTIGKGQRPFVIAEISANHHKSIDKAKQLIKIAADSGADAVKLQTYKPETLTIDCDNEYFTLGKGTIWEGRTLFDLYAEACTPWEWTEELMRCANDAGIR